MKIGFSGTRHGMTDKQRAMVGALLVAKDATVVYQGCCVGADAQFCEMCIEQLEAVHIVGYPCDLRSMVSKTACMACDEIHQPQPALIRNRDIVADCDLLIAAPSGMTEEMRSGTWATIRYARKAGKPFIIVRPDGTTTKA